ncbi:MAG TPA: MFS transporter [Terriglobales bacterium]|nr:MFS transporter [Terriglobales bacterium]
MTASCSNVRWVLIFWLFLLSAVAYLDRVNISVAGSSIASTYGLSNIQLGWIFSAFLVGYALFQTVGGYLAQRFGPRRVLAGGVFWWGIFTAVTASIPAGIGSALYLFMAVRFLLGAGEAVVYPASNQFIAQWIPKQERGIANGWIFAGVGAGAGFAPPLVTYIIIRHGWRTSFWVCAVIGFIAGTIWYLLARDMPGEHPHVSTLELARIEAGRSLPATQERESQKLSWRAVLASKTVLAVSLSYFCYGYVAWIYFSWFYIYLAQARGLNLKASALYAMLPFIAMAVCCLIGGTLNDRFSKRCGLRVGRSLLACVAIFAAGAFLAFGSEVSSARVASIVLAGGAGALYLSQSSFWSVTVDIAGRHAGPISGFMNMANQIGGAVTSSLTPVIAKHFGWTASFLVAASLCVVGALAWLAVDPERQLLPAASPAKLAAVTSMKDVQS